MLWVACASLIAALALGPGGALRAQSAPPTTFHGTVTAPDGDVEGGLEVIATIDGVVCSEDEPSLTAPPDGNGVAVTSYRVDVLSADARAGCGVVGAEVRFQVGERMAQETGIWLGQPQELNLTLPAGPTEPEETPEATATPQEPVEPTGTATPEEPVEPTETPEGTTTPEETVEPEATATEAVETTEPEQTPAPTEAVATEEATPTPEPTEVAEEPTATATPAATPVATATPAPTEPAGADEPAEPQEPEPAVAAAEDDGGGVSAVVIALAVVAGLAMVGVGVFSWLGRSRPEGGVRPAETREPVIGAAPTVGRRRRETPSLASIRDAIQSLFRRQ